jgi:hypothetical protein
MQDGERKNIMDVCFLNQITWVDFSRLSLGRTLAASCQCCSAGVVARTANRPVWFDPPWAAIKQETTYVNATRTSFRYHSMSKKGTWTDG